MANDANRDYLGKALDIAVRLALVAIIVLSAFRVFSPFISTVVWAVLIAIAMYPIFDKMKRLLGGRAKLAGALFIVITLAIVIVPTIMLTGSLIDGAREVQEHMEAGTLTIPPPSEKVKDWPLIGEKTYEIWHASSVDLQATAEKLGPQLKEIAAKLVSTVVGLGTAILQSILALIIAGILMMTSEGGNKAAVSIAKRLAGEEDGPAIVDIATGTIRSVVKGVILVALTQSLLAAIGLTVAGVPAVGLWALLVLVVAVIQLPPIIVLLPIAIWVFSANDNTVISVGFLIWSLIVSGSDGILKPIFLGRGVAVPMLVILIGAIGGMLQAGVLGLFIGPVVLAIGYQLFKAWVAEDEAPHKTEPKAETT
jgi:predicted PurR-regulated permease PerM